MDVQRHRNPELLHVLVVSNSGGGEGVWESLPHAVNDVMSRGLKIDVVGGSPPLTLH